MFHFSSYVRNGPGVNKNLLLKLVVNWNNINSTENETHTSELFLECLRDSFLYQHVKEPTRYRSQNVPSILDLIFTNEESMVSNLQYKPSPEKMII